MKHSFLILCSLLICTIVFSQGINKYDIQFSKNEDSAYINLRLYIDKNNSHQTYFLLSEIITIQEIKANNKMAHYSRVGDTIFIHDSKKITDIELKYFIPLNYYSQDDAFIFKREGKWYPYRKGELLIAEIQIDEPSYYIVCGQDKNNYQEIDVSNELHLFLLSKEMYDKTIYTNKNRPFHFYRNKKDTSLREDAFFQEFINSYDYFALFFNTALSNQPLHIIEFFGQEFQICQSLSNAIIFGSTFYQIYLLTPLISWIPHEMAHQWWARTLFFKESENRLFLEESVTEYLKIQYVKTKENGYNELLELYSNSISNIENRIPAQEIKNLSSQDAAIIIYGLLPLQLEEIANSYPDYKINEFLKNTFKKYQKQMIDYGKIKNHINNGLGKAIENLLLESD